MLRDRQTPFWQWCSCYAWPPGPGHLIDCARTQFNIERGYKLEAIIAELQRQDRLEPLDVVALQEVDIGCERSSFADTGMVSLLLSAA